MIQTIPANVGTPTTVALSAIQAIAQIRTRNGLDEASLNELAESIKVHGVIQPIIVAHGEAEGSYRLIAGERRVLAATIAGLEEIPAVIRHGTDAELAAVQAVENLQREDLALLDIADGLSALRTVYPRQIDLARAIGKSKAWVSKHERLAKLTPAVLEATAAGHLSDVETITTLDALARIKTDNAQQLLRHALQAAEDGRLSREAARTALAKAKGTTDQKSPVDGSNDDSDEDDGEEGSKQQASKEKFGKLELAEEPARALLAGLEYAQKHKPSSRPGEALIEAVRAFISKTWGE